MALFQFSCNSGHGHLEKGSSESHASHGECAGHNHEGKDMHAVHEGEEDEHEHKHEGEHDKHSGEELHEETDTHDKHESESEGVVIFSHRQAERVGLQVDTVKKTTFHNVIKVSGRIQATREGEQTIVSPISGTILFGEKKLTDGMPLKKGERLMIISSTKMQDGDLGIRLSAVYDAAKKEYDRASELLKDNIISQKHYDQAKLEYLQAKSAYDAYYENSSEKGVNISSSISGYLKTLLVDQGEFVSVGDPVAIVTQNKKVQLFVDVPEKYAKELPKIRSANFQVAYDDSLYRLSDMSGRLLSYGKSTTNGSFMLPVIFEFDNVCNALPGSYADVYLLTRKENNVITLPISSLLEEQGLYFVFVETMPEHYEKREVKLGHNDGERVVVSSGLTEGASPSPSLNVISTGKPIDSSNSATHPTVTF